ncbi:MAG: dipeptidase [Prevotellaceae bacterium]|jgi:acetylornithine deacetylase/succinyl-diaminopimelate desuccinylase-like protein|nr:dipeptidase [Prevotellaceae bacterium]
MSIIDDYIKKNEGRFLDELFELIRIPSISSQTEHKPDMRRAAEYWKKTLDTAGADKTEIFETEGNPIVYGEKSINPALPTVLVYAHYDVMPVDPVELWNSAPFEPEVRDGKIYARGADDDKGQGFMHAKAFESMVATNTLPCNVKFMIEGEEEIGSGSLKTWCAKNKELLKSDIILVSDTSMVARDVPSVTTGLRGLSYIEVEVTGPSRDLHSGIFGGAVANPINILCRMIASLHDENRRVTVKGFYDDVEEVSNEDRRELAKAPFSVENYKQSLNINSVWGEIGYTTPERTGIRPTLDINGIWGGYTGEGAKTVIPSKAYAKISMRLVPNQDSAKIAELFKAHFESLAPDCVTVAVTPHHGGQAYVSPSDSAGYRAAHRALTETFGTSPVPVRSGGSIPVIATFEQELGVKSVLLGFGLESDAIHSPNENYPLSNFYAGIKTIPLFYRYFTEEYTQ